MAARLRRFSAPACEPTLSRAARRAAGVYYTPPEIVRRMVNLILDPKTVRLPRLLDYACGAGEFLMEALRRLSESYGVAAARGSIFGIDIDPTAISAARERLVGADSQFPLANLIVGDALHEDCFSPASLDFIVGNPPYVSIRQLAKSLPAKQIERLRERFRTARGNFDLYTLFIERAIELLRPGGRCALIVPNKWATLDYARPCRELLLALTSIEHVIDLSSSGAFANASVYPQIIVFRKQPAAERHVIQFCDNEQGQLRNIDQRSLCATAFNLAPKLDVEQRVTTLPLGEVAKLACGTAGYAASKIVQRLIERPRLPLNSKGQADFITSGNIDRYAIRLGDVRFLKQRYQRPTLPLDCPELTAAKRQLFAGSKIVVAGMSRRLEAAWDDRGLALGVQVFAASDFQVDPFYLLALLNSKLLSYLFATRFAGKRLAGGYLAINKGQLARLPIRVISSRDGIDVQRRERLCELAAEGAVGDGGPALAKASLSHPTRVVIDSEIDHIVYQLYGLIAVERERVEGHFAEAVSRAA
jgi:SAM-dependent methyltransferase